jgi:excisionase family DNA binding protein
MDYRDPDWVAEKLGIDKNTIYRFLQEGTIPAIQLGRKWLISEKRLGEWLEQETDKQTRARRDAVSTAEGVVRQLDNYTTAARQALKHAHGEARRYAHAQLDQGHLLLGVAEGDAAAGRLLKKLGVTPELVRAELERQLTPGPQPVPRRLPRSPDSKRAMRIASKLARKEAPGDSPLNRVGTDHLLLGIHFSRQGIGHDILKSHGVTRRSLRAALRGRDPDVGPQSTNS